MGEPSQLIPPLGTLPKNELTSIINQRYPGALIQETDGQYALFTLHSIGDTPHDAMQKAIKEYDRMSDDGKNLRTMLSDIYEDLRTPGMSRVRAESLYDILTICENALNGAIITRAVNWIEIPGITRELCDLRRRIETRLNMIAHELQMQERQARRETVENIKDEVKRDIKRRKEATGLAPDGLTEYQRLQLFLRRGVR